MAAGTVTTTVKAAVAQSNGASQKKQGSKRSRSDLSEGLLKGSKKAARTVASTQVFGKQSVLHQDAHPTVACKLTPEARVEAILGTLQAVIVNLDRRPDRLAACDSKLKSHCPWLQCSRFSASDGRCDQIAFSDVVKSWHTRRNVVYQKLRSKRKSWDDLHTYHEKHLDLSPGERGCAMSHIRAWRHCLEVCKDDCMPLLVLEDDAEPTAEFTTNLKSALAALPSDPHVLYLGYSQASEWKSEISTNLVESDYVWTTVGYLVWPAGARLMLSQLPVDQPVDNFMANLCAQGQLRSYCVRPKILLQAEAWNVNSDVGHSDEVTPSDVLHSDSLYWGSMDPRAALDQPGGENGTLFWDMGSSDSDGEDDSTTADER